MLEKRSSTDHPARSQDFLQSGGDRKRLKYQDRYPAQRSCAALGKKDPQLCHECSRFDFQAAFVGECTQSGTLIANVGQRFRDPIRDVGCLLCPILRQSRLSHEQIGHPEPSLYVNGHDELRAYPFLWNAQLLDYSQDPARTVETGSMVLMIVPSRSGCLVADDRFVEEAVEKHIQTEECAILQRNVPGNMFLPREPSRMFDLQQTSSWIEYCESHHKPLCLPPKSERRGVKLLNCDTLLVEKATDESRYVALSYVWGQYNPVEDYVVRDERGLQVLPLTAPRVISDAISVTKSLGHQYLWIDKLCIDQENALERHQQVQQMNVIYQEAELTIIAAAGSDECHGLPGATSQRNSSSQTLSVGDDLSIIRTVKDPHCAIRQSVWSSRGWTFQEAVLSRRRLVFLEDQVYFECNAMNCYESITSPLDSMHIQNRKQMHDCFRGGVFDRNENMRFGIFDIESMEPHELFFWYLSSIEQYTARILRFDSDACTAFAGVMRRFAKRKRPIYEIWGLPYPDIDKNGAIDAYFAHSLMWSHVANCWENSSVPRRRGGFHFPSWSWAGWSGQVKYKISENSMTPDCSSLIRRFELKDPATGEVKPLSSLGFNTNFGMSPYTTLKVEALIVPLWFFKYNSVHGMREEDAIFYPGTLPAREQRTWKAGKYPASLHLSQGAASESSFAQDIEAKRDNRWRCMLLGYGRYVTGIMILRKEKDAQSTSWVRAGLFYVHYNSRSFIRDMALLAEGPEVLEIE